jgi:AraC-like DNA-binding protein
MRNKKKNNLLAHQLDHDETQNHDLLQTYINSTPVKDSNRCRLEYLKKLYYFSFTEEDGEQVFNLNSHNTDPDADKLVGKGFQGDDFCEKYCVETKVCSGKVIILFPKNEKPLPGNDQNNPPERISDLPDRNYSQQRLILPWDDGIKKQSLLTGEYLILKRTLSVIEACYKDYGFSVDHLAIQLNLSVSQLNRKLNALTGHPAGYLIRLFRLQRSATLLLEGNLNVSEVCFETGFNSLSYFCRSFKKHFGCIPSSYKSNMAEKLNILRQKDN